MEVKDRIYQKAYELFNKYGIRSVSMDDIAAELGMSKKTLYQYYSDKEELVGIIINTTLEGNRARCARDQEASENAVHELFLAFDMAQEMLARMNPIVIYDLQKYHPAVYQQFLEHRNTFLYRMVSKNIERGIREELFRPEVDVDIIARHRIETIFSAFNPEIFPNNRTHLVHIEQQLFDLFIYGLVNAKGQKLIQKYKSQRTKK